MTWSQGTVSFKDAFAVVQPVIAFTDGVNFAFAHSVLNTLGANINPATADNQATMVTSLAAIATSVNAATPAGTNIIGKVTTDQTTHGTTDLVAADITKVNGAAVPVGHGLAATALRVEIPTDGTGVVGLNAGSNTIGATVIGGQTVSSGVITRPNNTTAYAVGGLVADNTSSTTVNTSITNGTYTIAAARGVNVVSAITALTMFMSGTTDALGLFRVHFYNSKPTVTNGDGSAWLTAATGYLGFFDVTMSQVFSGSMLAGTGVRGVANMMTFAPISGTANLYFLVEARGQFVPISNGTFQLQLEVN